jgi:hypothetical protein
MQEAPAHRHKPHHSVVAWTVNKTAPPLVQLVLVCCLQGGLQTQPAACEQGQQPGSAAAANCMLLLNVAAQLDSLPDNIIGIALQKL